MIFDDDVINLLFVHLVDFRDFIEKINNYFYVLELFSWLDLAVKGETVVVGKYWFWIFWHHYHFYLFVYELEI